MLWRVVLKILSHFDAEAVHHLSFWVMRMLGPVMRLLPPPRATQGADLSTQVAGVSFRHPIGLAAGFDKNAEILDLLPFFGFAFAEVGTVTPRPQPGNPKPRLFRRIDDKTIFNRMGFNNLGATMVAHAVRAARKKLPEWFKVGVNLGKNKDTPLDVAHEDYAQALVPFEGIVDFVVVNVSSPNTPGLRNLQDATSIRQIHSGLTRIMSTWTNPVPIFLKLAPELDGNDLKEVHLAVLETGMNGLILTNTLKGDAPDAGQTGGWSGSLLTLKARQALEDTKKAVNVPIVSVGGILDAEEGLRRLDAGAALIEIYSGWIFGGPFFVRRMLKQIKR